MGQLRLPLDFYLSWMPLDFYLSWMTPLSPTPTPLSPTPRYPPHPAIPPETSAWDTHAANFRPLKNLHCPKLDRGLSALLEDMDQRGLLKETLVVAVGEFGRSPRLGVSTSGNSNSPDGRDHWPNCYSAVIAGAGIARGAQYGESDATASSPKEKPVHPTDLLATVYYALGIDPDMEIRNHLNQPRELVKGKPVMDLWA